MENDAICTLVTRLARPHVSGGEVVERAALLAEGGDFSAVMAWITAHGGEPEPIASPDSGERQYGSLVNVSRGADSPVPRRFVLPPGALARAAPAPPG